MKSALAPFLTLSLLICTRPLLAAQNEQAAAHIDARMMRQPAVSATQIAFVYAGDIWLADKAGGIAVRISSPKGEESFPRFSPDGQLLAFTGDYDGNEDIYVMPVAGGVPTRITHHGAPDRVLGWYPGGSNILYATSMTSPKNRFNQLYKISDQGGLPQKLPVPYGEFGAISPDGKILAYVPISVDFRTWKRYRGGMNPDIWLFNLQTLTATNLTQSPDAESVPMWHGDTLYFLADRDENKRANIWACDLREQPIPAGHLLQGVRRSLPQHRSRRHRFRERRAALSARFKNGKGARGRNPRSHRPRDPQTPPRKCLQLHSECHRLTNGKASPL